MMRRTLRLHISSLTLDNTMRASTRLVLRVAQKEVERLQQGLKKGAPIPDWSYPLWHFCTIRSLTKSASLDEVGTENLHCAGCNVSLLVWCHILFVCSALSLCWSASNSARPRVRNKQQQHKTFNNFCVPNQGFFFVDEQGRQSWIANVEMNLSASPSLMVVKLRCLECQL